MPAEVRLPKTGVEKEDCHAGSACVCVHRSVYVDIEGCLTINELSFTLLSVQEYGSCFEKSSTL